MNILYNLQTSIPQKCECMPRVLTSGIDIFHIHCNKCFDSGWTYKLQYVTLFPKVDENGDFYYITSDHSSFKR